MDLEKELLKKQSLTQCNRIIKWIADDESRFRRLTDAFHSRARKILKKL
jgi:hypothetical protein